MNVLEKKIADLEPTSIASAPEREPGVIYTKPWVVELILDLAGYLPTRPLASLVALEPSAGDGAFLIGMARRLVESCRLNNTPLHNAANAIAAFEIDARSAENAIGKLYNALVELGIDPTVARRLSRSWIRIGDFLEASLSFPIADFVIGNPPYIRLEDIPENKASLYRYGFSAMRGRADVYVAFYQAALLQLKQRGVCAFICADRWMLNDYGAALREFITCEGYNIRCIIEAHDVAAFETEVSAYPAITIIAREKQGAVIVGKAFPGIESTDRHEITRMLSECRSSPVLKTSRFPEWFTGSQPWPCNSSDALDVLKYLEKTCIPLESDITGTQIGIGVASGADRVFIASGKVDVEEDRLLPLAMARDLKGGRVEWSGHYLINPWDESGLVQLSAYPRMSAYLANHRELLSGRHTAKGRPGHWHKTIDRVNLSLLPKPKLYIADIKERLLPTLDLGTTYPHHNLYWITSDKWDLRVLGGLLLSDFGQFFITSYGVRMRGGFLRFQAQYLRRIRVPSPDQISPKLARKLVKAFETQDIPLATEAALDAYEIDSLPL